MSEALNKFKQLAQDENLVVIDVETTGLGKKPHEHLDEIVEITILNLHGQVLLRELVQPVQLIPQVVINIHGINNVMVREAPTWREVAPMVQDVLEGKIVTAWNLPFDTELMRQSSLARRMNPIPRNWREQCAMDLYAQLTALPGQERAKFVNLKKACEREHIDQSQFEGLHSATGDCQRVLAIIKAMATRDPGEFLW